MSLADKGNEWKPGTDLYGCKKLETLPIRLLSMDCAFDQLLINKINSQDLILYSMVYPLIHK